MGTKVKVINFYLGSGKRTRPVGKIDHNQFFCSQVNVFQINQKKISLKYFSRKYSIGNLQDRDETDLV